MAAGVRVALVRNVVVSDSERRLGRAITMLLGEPVVLYWSLTISSEIVIIRETVCLELVQAD